MPVLAVFAVLTGTAKPNSSRPRISTVFRIAIANHKGGSAKTTIAINAAAALAGLGRRVLLVDLDPQASASHWLDVSASGQNFLETLLDAGDLEPLIQTTDCGIDVIPCGRSFVSLDRFALEQPGGETLLRTAFERLEDRWDYAFLDCPPNLHIGTVNALTSAHVGLVPVAAHVLSLDSLGTLVQAMIRIRDTLNHEFHLSGLVACRVDHRTNYCTRIVDLLRERFGRNVYTTEISEAVRIAEAPERHRSVTAHDPKGRPAKEFLALVEELERRERETIERAKHGTAHVEAQSLANVR